MESRGDSEGDGGLNELCIDENKWRIHYVKDLEFCVFLIITKNVRLSMLIWSIGWYCGCVCYVLRLEKSLMILFDK